MTSRISWGGFAAAFDETSARDETKVPELVTRLDLLSATTTMEQLQKILTADWSSANDRDYMMSDLLDSLHRACKSKMPLRKAIKEGYLAVVKFLVDRGARDAKAFRVAIRFGHADVATYLLDHQMGTLQSVGVSTVFVVCENDHDACLLLLLERTTIVNSGTVVRFLQHAVCYHSLAVVEVLLRRFPEHAHKMLQMAGSATMMRLLITYGADASERWFFHSFIRAIELGDLDMVRLWVSHGQTPHRDMERALRCALRFGHHEVAQFLLLNKAYPVSEQAHEKSFTSKACSN